MKLSLKSRFSLARHSSGACIVLAAGVTAFTAAVILTLLAVKPAAATQGQGGQVTFTITGSRKLKLALPDFVASGVVGAAAVPADIQKTFNDVLWNDLYQSGVVELVGKSMYPTQIPASPNDILNPSILAAWGQDPVSAQRLAYGQIQIANSMLMVKGYLDDITNPGSPYVFGKQYVAPLTNEEARITAHEFADALVAALGGGAGIASSRIAFISDRSGLKQVWIMDYDGANAHQLSHDAGFDYSPRISPDGKKIAYMNNSTGSSQIKMLDVASATQLPFPTFRNANMSPAWSPDGTQIAFASSMKGGGFTNIYVCRADGGGLKQLTFTRSDDVSPVWNPKTGAQIAFVSDQAGLPGIYIIGSDGSNRQSITPGGYASAPSWSPNGLLLAYAWVRGGGGENSGALDIYIYDIAKQQNYIQMTHNEEHNDYPSWAPDGRHIVFQSGTPSRTQLYSVLADGTSPAVLTQTGSNSMPNWSWH